MFLQSLKADMSTLNAATQAYDHLRQHQQEEQQQVVETMMRGLVEVDHELAESERRYRALRSAVARGAAGTDLHATSSNTSMNHSRSTSRNSRYSATTTSTSHLASTPATAAAAAATAFIATHPQHHTANASGIAQTSSHTHSQSVLHNSTSRHPSPSALRPHSSAPAPYHSASFSSSSGTVGTPYAAPHGSTTPTASSRVANSPSLYQRQSRELGESQQLEQRLTRDFLTKTSPTHSPAHAATPLAAAHQSAQQYSTPAAAAPAVPVMTHAHTVTNTTNTSYVLSTSASNATSRLRTHRESSSSSSYQLPVAGQSTGSGSLRVNKSSAPVPVAAAAVGAPGAATAAASMLPRRTSRGSN